MIAHDMISEKRNTSMFCSIKINWSCLVHRLLVIDVPLSFADADINKTYIYHVQDIGNNNRVKRPDIIMDMPEDDMYAPQDDFPLEGPTLQNQPKVVLTVNNGVSNMQGGRQRRSVDPDRGKI